MINNLPGQLGLFPDKEPEKKFVDEIFDHVPGPEPVPKIKPGFRDPRDCKYNMYLKTDFYDGFFCRKKCQACDKVACEKFKFKIEILKALAL